MTLVAMKNMLIKTREEHYAVGQYNINGLQCMKAILQAVEDEQAPVIVAASDRIVDYLGGFETIVSVVKGLVEHIAITCRLLYNWTTA